LGGGRPARIGRDYLVTSEGFKKPGQEAFVGNQSGGRVFLFLNTDDFERDYKEMVSRGVKFVREPKREAYGMVAVFEDLYGNLWDLLELNEEHPIARRAV
jgi:uncharacterized glyoxalase superfamily protein PhnB